MTKTRTSPGKPAPPSDADERLVDWREVLERFFPVHRSTLSQMIQTGRFPAPIILAPSKLFWRWARRSNGSTIAKSIRPRGGNFGTSRKKPGGAGLARQGCDVMSEAGRNENFTLACGAIRGFERSPAFEKTLTLRRVERTAKQPSRPVQFLFRRRGGGSWNPSRNHQETFAERLRNVCLGFR